MKKYVGFFFIVYILMQINNLSYGQDDRWIYVTEGVNSVSYIDKLTVECDSDGNIFAWIKSECIKDCDIESSEKTVDYFLINTKFYSQKRKSRTIEFITYYTDKTTNNHNVEYKDDILVPDSIAEITYDYVFSNFSCK